MSATHERPAVDVHGRRDTRRLCHRSNRSDERDCERKSASARLLSNNFKPWGNEQIQPRSGGAQPSARLLSRQTES